MPTVQRKELNDYLIEENRFGKVYAHESYGVMYISRGSGSHDATLFGSSIKHHNTISLSIHHAELHRSDLHYDSHFGTKRIIELELSPTQFADAITSLNIGCGTPVTIRWLHDKGSLERPPFEGKLEQFRNEFAEVTEAISKECDDVINDAERRKYPKKFIKELDLLRGRIKSHFPFLNKQFTEQMEQTVKEAKGEVEAFVSSAVKAYGIEAIRNQAPQIESKDDTKLLKGDE